MRLDFTNGKLIYSDKLLESEAFISNGTLVDNAERGSSIIGDGLAAAALDFYDVEDKPDRSRVIIFSTDNELYGTEIITLPEAGQMCQDRDIIVYGIGTEKMASADRAMMKEVVEDTGGTFYYGEDDDIVENIVAEIRQQMATLDDTQYEIIEYETPEVPFKYLLLSLCLTLLLAFILKV